MELCQQTSERMVLSCEISRPNAMVRWYRDGLEVEESENLLLEVDGVYRRLIIPETTVKDSAEYVYCEVSRSNAEVTWKKNGEEVEDSRKVTILEDGVTRQLTIHSVMVEDAGQYVCDAKDDVMDFSVKVQEPPVQIIGNSGNPEHHVMVAGDDLILECEVSRPNAAVEWIWNGELLKPSCRINIESYDVVRKLVLSGLQPSDSGEYICDAVDDKVFTIVEVQGEDAVFKCVVSPADNKLVWRLNGKKVALNERTVISCNGLCHMLCISNCMVSDGGRVTADAEGVVSEAELQVQAEVQWMRQGVLIHPGAKYTLKHKGRKHFLTIHKVAVSDRGTYNCETLHDRTQAQLTVERECPRLLAINAYCRGLFSETFCPFYPIVPQHEKSPLREG
ncbi:hypothetical protein XENOCAPTIV_027956 [Xenoophorus captivus]|uniref:Ig-like domain-containing protein n=1 Tax=Xenoophorus captivus TaxID=1517983 RepID=A0ABV0S3J3_9TELE